jgi:protein-L-isoaspartate O-methyltransferase
MKMTNRGNRFIYRLWAPVYDATVNHLFIPGRMRAMDLLGLQPGESVLLVGIGTGGGPAAASPRGASRGR